MTKQELTLCPSLWEASDLPALSSVSINILKCSNLKREICKSKQTVI